MGDGGKKKDPHPEEDVTDINKFSSHGGETSESKDVPEISPPEEDLGKDVETNIKTEE